MAGFRPCSSDSNATNLGMGDRLELLPSLLKGGDTTGEYANFDHKRTTMLGQEEWVWPEHRKTVVSQVERLSCSVAIRFVLGSQYCHWLHHGAGAQKVALVS